MDKRKLIVLLDGGPLLFQDNFNRANGAIGGGWTGATWTVSSNKVVNTPTEGSDVVVNGAFDSDTVWVKGTDWVIGSGVATKTAGTASNLTQNSIIVNNTFYDITFDMTRTAGSLQVVASGANPGELYTGDETVNLQIRSLSGGNSFAFLAGSTYAGTVDNVIIKPITLSTLFSTRAYATPNVYEKVDITRTARKQSGLILCLDSTASPANFIIVYMTGTGNITVDKLVGGVFSNVSSTAVTYSEGATLAAYKNGTSVTVYYNGAVVGTVNTITDAGIISNKNHGLFSTNSGNSFDNFKIYNSYVG